jgi:light-regulated signal transduction histidine kinase (bacteriophytochrome)
MGETAAIQPGGYLLELSSDWIVLRASENIHRLLHESHVTLIDEPLGKFVQAQALHDLRNLFSRLSGTMGVARAYGARLTDDNQEVDLAFQSSGGKVLLEAVPSSGPFGECFGSVAGLIDGLKAHSGQALLDNGARRMRALTGYDRVTLNCGGLRAESNRGALGKIAPIDAELPAMVSDCGAEPVPLFPRVASDRAIGAALLRAPQPADADQLRQAGMAASLLVPLKDGEFRCESRKARAPSFELHAAAEMFAQMFAMRLEIDRLKAD